MRYFLIVLELKLKPLTYNQHYRPTKSGKLVKTGAGLAYDEELSYLLREYSTELSDFREKLDSSNSILKVEYRHYNTKYFIKDGSRLNKKAGDVDGIIKVLQDKIFDLIGVDDFMIKDLRSVQYPSDRDFVKVIIEEIPHSDLHTFG